MATFPAIYRAKATQLIGNSRLKVLIPQVYGDQDVDVTDFLGPPKVGMGWVFFQGGNPEFPVWMTRHLAGGVDLTDMAGTLAALIDRLEALETVPIEQVWPAGSIRASISGVADVGWLLFGQTVADAPTKFPTLWGRIPPGWQSGTSMILPSDVDRVLRGSSLAGLGAISGANLKTLTIANLPAHLHAVSINSGTVSADHTHGFTSGNPSANHVHGGVDHLHYVSIQSGGFSTNHYHGPNAGYSDYLGGVVGGPYWMASGDYGAGHQEYNGMPSTYWAHIDHSHGINGWSGAADRGLTTGTVSEWHTHSGNTGGISTNHYHGVSGNTGETGSATALNVQEEAINVRFQIKAH